jgi:hypothetical protein
VTICPGFYTTVRNKVFLSTGNLQTAAGSENRSPWTPGLKTPAIQPGHNPFLLLLPVIFGLMSYRMLSSPPFDISTDQLIRQLLQSNPGMKMNEKSRRTKVGGQNALMTTLLSPSAYQKETEVDTLLTVARPKGLFYAIFVAPQSRMKNLETTFQSMIHSLRFSK